MNALKDNMLSIAALLAMTILSFYFYDELPNILPTQMGSDGEVLESIPKQLAVSLLPGIFFAVVLTINVLIAISPDKFTMPNSKQAMHVIIFGLGVLLLSVHYFLLFGNGDMVFFTEFFSYGMALFLIITGNVMGKIERNFALGIKTPWAIDSEENWRATHRLAARLMVIAGIILLVCTPFYRHIGITVPLSVAPLIIPAIYSFIYFQKHERGKEGSSTAL